VKVVIPFMYGDLKIHFTPLPNTLHNIMLQIVEKNMITFPPIKPLDPNKPKIPRHKFNAYCHFHQQNGHDTKICNYLKHLVQDLIDFGQFSIGGVKDQGNKLFSPPNQNFQIFTNPMPNHNISFVKASKIEKNNLLNVDMNI
jgi:hypothetical protein